MMQDFEKDVQDAYDDCFLYDEDGTGLSLHSTWGGVHDNLNNDYDYSKRVFFELLRRLLNNKKIAFMLPYSASREESVEFGGYTIWNAPTEKQLSFMEEHWPEGTTDVYDDDLVIYLYGGTYCMYLCWYNKDGVRLNVS